MADARGGHLLAERGDASDELVPEHDAWTARTGS
jgi:hypothetical protein